MAKGKSLAFLAWIALAGCGGAEEVGRTTGGPLVEVAPARSEPVNARGDTEVRARVGEAGGTLALQNGARLVIPPGALAEETDVLLKVGAEGYGFGDAERQRPLGPTLLVEPAIVSASGAPFELSVPQLPLPTGFEQADLAFAVEDVHEGARAIDTLATHTRWQFYPVAVEDGRFVVRTTGLAGHRIQFGVAR